MKSKEEEEEDGEDYQQRVPAGLRGARAEEEEEENGENYEQRVPGGLLEAHAISAEASLSLWEPCFQDPKGVVSLKESSRLRLSMAKATATCFMGPPTWP